MHAIFGERFASLRQPAWHSLGKVYANPFTAEQALEDFGSYEVITLPLTVMFDGQVMRLPNKAIVRKATTDAPAVPFGVVSDDYELIGPRAFARLWDSNVKAPVETIAALREGRVMFISTKLPTMDIAGEEVENYMVAVNGMDGGHDAKMLVTPVRVVCQNTLVAGEMAASANFRMAHTTGVAQRMGEWLALLERQAQETTRTIKEAFTVLAGYHLKAGEMETVVNLSYPDPTLPRNNAPADVVEARMKLYEADKLTAERKRSAAIGLFNGEGTGMTVESLLGSGWYAYNAVAETEQYRRGAFSDENAAYDMLFGKRARSTAVAFETLLTLAQGKQPARARMGVFSNN